METGNDETNLGASVAPDDIRAQMASRRYLKQSDASFWHGRLYDGPFVPPLCSWRSEKKPREDHEAADWLTASEYADSAEVTAIKVKMLASLLQASRRTVLYTGAGISASVVGQAALSGTNKVGWVGKGRQAQPTPTHYALAKLGQAGLIHTWVQQNHDGLPQKAGFPQELICEVHGSWFDPSNPVVKYSGCLKREECEWMEREASHAGECGRSYPTTTARTFSNDSPHYRGPLSRTGLPDSRSPPMSARRLLADLVLVMGTSLGGLNADQVASACAKRSLSGLSLGSALVNLQQTEQDGKMTLRAFCTTDDFLRLLLPAVGLQPLESPHMSLAPKFDVNRCVLVPYDASGRRIDPGAPAARRMWLDLSDGAKVRLFDGHNCQGAQQPSSIHIGANKGAKFKGKPIANPGKGFGVVKAREDDACCLRVIVDGASFSLGLWWIDAAARGGPAHLPVVNQAPRFEGDKSTIDHGRGDRASPRRAVAAPRAAGGGGAGGGARGAGSFTTGSRSTQRQKPT